MTKVSGRNVIDLEGGPETWLDLDWKKKKKRIMFRQDKSHQDSG